MKILPDVPVIALTATMNKIVERGIIDKLDLRSKNFKLIKTSVFRPNIKYEIQFVDLLKDPVQDCIDFIQNLKVNLIFNCLYSLIIIHIFEKIQFFSKK